MMSPTLPKFHKFARFWKGSLTLLALLAGCVSSPLAVEPALPATLPPLQTPARTDATGQVPPTLTVAAAADLQFAFSEIAALFEAQEGVKVNLVFGSTGLLAQQIANGAPYDLFAAADQAYIQDLANQGLIRPDSLELYAQGRIVLAVTRSSGLTIKSLSDLLQPEVRFITIANPEHAPYGMAAKQALEASGLWQSLQPKLVYGENVRQSLQYLQSGDAQAGIIALSVAQTPEITWTLLPAELHQPMNQMLGVLTSSPQPELATRFIAFINGPQGRPIMKRYGFLLPGETGFPESPRQP